jgi:hypothetical protein
MQKEKAVLEIVTKSAISGWYLGLIKPPAFKLFSSPWKRSRFQSFFFHSSTAVSSSRGFGRNTRQKKGTSQAVDCPVINNIIPWVSTAVQFNF